LADRDRRWRNGLAMLVLVVGVGVVLFLISPKCNSLTVSDVLSSGTLWGLFTSQFGAGIFEWASLARIGTLVLLVAFVLVVFFRFRNRRYRRVLLDGFVVLLAAWLPFVATA